MRPFPVAARIEVPQALARDLASAARALPARDNEAYYDDALQRAALAALASRCTDGLAWLLEEIRLRLARRPFGATLSGLEFDAENRLFIAICRALGPLVSKPLSKPRAQLVHYLYPDADWTSPQGHQVYTELFHTDGADWPEPVDLLAMYCVRPDQRGEGRSRLIDMHTIRQELERQFGPTVPALLEGQPMPWLLAPEFGNEVIWRPVLGPDSLCWRRYTIELALNHAGLELDAAAIHALDAVEAVMAATTSVHEWLMRHDELLLLDNRKCLHARTAISRSRPSDRLMIRAWLRRESRERGDGEAR